MNLIKNQRGMALVTVLIIASILTILGITIWHYSTRDVMGAERAESKMQAYYLAKSGAEALAQYITTNPDNIHMSKFIDSLIAAPESRPVELGGDIPGNFQVKVRRDDSNSLIISSTGTVDNVKATVQLILEQKNTGPNLDVAIFSKGKMNLSGNARVTGNVSTNSIRPKSVQLSGNSYIYGNLIVGPGGRDDVIDPPSKLSGSVENLPSKKDYELPNFPMYPEDLTPRGSLEDINLITQSSRYTDIKVKNRLTIYANNKDINIVVDNLILNGNIVLAKNGEGQVYLYINDTFKLNGNAQININGDPRDIIIYYKGNELKLSGKSKIVASIFAEKANIKCSGNGEITGHIITGGNEVNIGGNTEANVRAIYAPNALVEIKGNGTIRGSVIANSIEATGNTDIIFDDSIMDAFADIIEASTGGGSSYSKGLWQ